MPTGGLRGRAELRATGGDAVAPAQQQRQQQRERQGLDEHQAEQRRDVETHTRGTRRKAGVSWS
jgi:hypothetical protein